ncbi:MAG: CPBP family intramembrane metalloprotease [Pirellulales bacterium]|nr:CPBP family intramembrane metalloprotease [Pirellulales bacterium]
MKHIASCVWVCLFAAAAVGFALVVHRADWAMWRWLFLALMGLGLCGGWATLDDPAGTLWGRIRSPRPAYWIVALACLGLVLAVCYRRLLEMPGFPSSLHAFVVAAACIGLTEEFLWRGWIQGALAGLLGWPTAVLLAAASHAAYKTALFIFPPVGQSPFSIASLAFLAGCTFVVGAGLGFSRVRQGTIGPAIAFHVVFDILVYGSRATAPWWVW